MSLVDVCKGFFIEQCAAAVYKSNFCVIILIHVTNMGDAFTNWIKNWLFVNTNLLVYPHRRIPTDLTSKLLTYLTESDHNIYFETDCFPQCNIQADVLAETYQIKRRKATLRALR